MTENNYQGIIILSKMNEGSSPNHFVLHYFPPNTKDIYDRYTGNGEISEGEALCDCRWLEKAVSWQSIFAIGKEMETEQLRKLREGNASPINSEI